MYPAGRLMLGLHNKNQASTSGAGSFRIKGMTIRHNAGFGWIRSVYDILFDSEIRELTSAHRRNPADPDLAQRLGDIYLERFYGNQSTYAWNRAVFYFEKIEKMNVWSGSCMTTLVADRLARGKTELALSTAKEAVGRILSLFYRRSQSGEVLADLTSMAHAFLFLKHISTTRRYFDDVVALIPENIQMQIACDNRIESKAFCLPMENAIRIENRIYSRIPSSLRVNVHTEWVPGVKDGSESDMTATVIDLSEGGARFFGRVNLNAGDKIEMSFQSVTGGVSVKLAGTACWTLEDKGSSTDLERKSEKRELPLRVVGVEFSGLSKESRKALAATIGSERA